jgi:hypothetical protein
MTDSSAITNIKQSLEASKRVNPTLRSKPPVTHTPMTVHKSKSQNRLDATKFNRDRDPVGDNRMTFDLSI